MAKLNDALISEFVETTLPKEDSQNREFTAYGTVTTINNDGSVNVLLDGGEETVCQSTVGCVEDDRVIVSFKNREPVVTSNITKPVATSEEVNSKIVNAVNIFAENGTFSGSVRVNGDYTSGDGQVVAISGSGWAPIYIYSNPEDWVNDSLYISATEFRLQHEYTLGDVARELYVRYDYLRYRDALEGNRYTQLDKDQLFVRQYQSWTYYKYDGAHITSDIRLKKDIGEIDPELAGRLIPVQFRYKDDEKIHYGFIAQDIQKVLPDAVTEEEEGYLSLNYQELIAPLYALVQKLQKEVDELRKEVKALET